MTIQFKEEELNVSPLLPKIKAGIHVVGLKNSDYSTLYGVVSEVKYGNDKETENETILDIYVHFLETEGVEEFNIEVTHPHLNGTSISGVICGEDELGFLFEEELKAYQTLEGKAICPHCYEAIENVTETQSTDIYWDFNKGKYQKVIGELTSGGKRCSLCNGDLEEISEFFKH